MPQVVVELEEMAQTTSQKRIAEQMTVFPMCRLCLKERIHERIAEQTVIIPAPQIKEAIVEVVHIISPERTSGRIDEQIVDVAVDVGRTRRGCGVDFTGANATTKRWSLCGIACSTNYAQEIPQECISERIVEQIVYVSVLEILEKSVKVESVSPQRRKINAQIMEFVGGRERSFTAAGAATRRGADRRGSRAAHREGAP